MSPKQWFALLCFYITYLFLGANVFYHIEHTKELANRADLLQERIAVNELLVQYASPENIEMQNEILSTLSSYCDHPVTNYTLDEYPVDFEWTFFHSFWFSFITCSTVGYGNSSPHDQPGQAFLIFFALIGLPVNGFVLAYLGAFFSKTFTGIYNRYKGHESSETDGDDPTKKYGLFGKIAMFLIPGIAFFIFLPACLFSYFEDWPYVRSVYYSFVTLTTIGFGDFVPTFQDGQARKFGVYFTFYQIFILVWNFIGVGYFIMIIGFIAKGMQSKRIARLEHQLSMNIKETQHRIWTEVHKDVNFLRRILNEAHLTKLKPVYTDSLTRDSFNSLPRFSSCPDISIFRNEYQRKRAYSQDCGQLLESTTSTVRRVLSDGDLLRIDKDKTFECSGSLTQTKDLLSSVFNALGSIRPINEDVHSCLELGIDDELPNQTDDSYEWTWDGNNSQQMKEYMRNKRNSIASMFTFKLQSKKIADGLERQTQTQSSFISRINPFKQEAIHQEKRRCSVNSQNSNLQKYLENTSRGRESRLSQLTCENMELLENVTIADLIRAVEGTETQRHTTPETPLLDERKANSRLRVDPSVTLKHIGRGSLGPTHDYTTIFESKNMQRPRSDMLALNQGSAVDAPKSRQIITPKKATRRIRSTSSSIPTVHEHYSSIQSLPMLQRTMSLHPNQSTRNTVTSQHALPQMPMITLQAPNVSRSNLLWHPEYQDENPTAVKYRMKRKRADSS
ncbi:Open rectifier potassium channel protein 1 [Pseudolycoriella hygida]|uniref:Open rectifier potassium channel protein 1 n=1 Tax=Pseudolycoriella hygida TaxID=35572 RepID=A0A9Q0NA46_9DIPT|nr:Open rectifier potassium channel protein 1 [Pseudolycoriella hygida]